MLTTIKKTYANCIMVGPYTLSGLKSVGADFKDFIPSSVPVPVISIILSIQIDDVNGFDDRLITPFLERLNKIGLTAEDIDIVRECIPDHVIIQGQPRVLG